MATPIAHIQPPTTGWIELDRPEGITAGRMRVKRTGSKVRFEMWDITCSTTENIQMWSIPVGFRAENRQTVPVYRGVAPLGVLQLTGPVNWLDYNGPVVTNSLSAVIEWETSNPMP